MSKLKSSPGIPAILTPHSQRNLFAYLARHKNIDQLIDDGILPDPLYGGYRIIPQQQIVTSFQGKGQIYRMAVLSTQLEASTSGVFRSQVIGLQEMGSPEKSRHLALTSGDLDGDGRDEIASIYQDAGQLRLVLSEFTANALGTSGTFSPQTTTALNIPSAGRLALTNGLFTADSQRNGLILAWADSSARLHLQVYEVSPELTPTLKGEISDEVLASPSSDYALTRGDFDGDGIDEVAVAWHGSGDRMYVKAYQIEPNWIFVPGARSSGEAITGKKHIALTASDFNYDAVDEIAVAWERTTQQTTLQLFQITPALNIQPKGRYTDGDIDTSLYGGAHIALTFGAFDLGVSPEGIQPSQIVLGYEIENNALMLRLFQTDSNLNLDGSKYLKASRIIGDDLSYALVDFGLQLAAGHLAGGALNCVVIGAVGASRSPWIAMAGLATVTTGIVQVTGNLTQFGPLGAAYTYELAQDPNLDLYLGLALGDLSGTSVRVGPPRQYDARQVEQILAVINAPPLHLARYIDEKGEEVEVEINFEGMSYVNFENEKQRQTMFSSQYMKTWGFSEEVRAKLGISIVELNAGLTTRYGEDFSRTTSSTTEQTFTLGKSTLWQDDAIIRAQMDYTVWEYPVYNSPGSGPDGYMLVVFPSLLGPSIEVIDGKDLNSFYSPNHQVSNILSYPETPPPDFSNIQKISTEWKATLGQTSSEAIISWQTLQEEDGQSSSNSEVTVKKGISITPPVFKGLRLGLEIEVEGTYGETEIQSTFITFQETTTISYNFNPIMTMYAYSVRPLIYWSRPWGYLNIDYVVTGLENPLFRTWWQDIYEARTDLAFALPWFDGSLGKQFKHLTRDIFFQKAEDGVTIQITIHNYSLKPATAIEVHVYNGNPESGGVQIEKYSVPSLPKRQSYTYSFVWAPPGDGVYDIYAVIDPDNKIDDLFPPNNRGWNRVDTRLLKAALPNSKGKTKRGRGKTKTRKS